MLLVMNISVGKDSLPWGKAIHFQESIMLQQNSGMLKTLSASPIHCTVSSGV